MNDPRDRCSALEQHSPRTRLWCLGTALAVVLSIIPFAPAGADAAPVPVRFPEGLTHGFLLVRSAAGDIVGHGELTQTVKEGGVAESRLVFRFQDGSIHDEKVAFSQQRVFTLIRYQLSQRGPSFPQQMDVLVDRGTSTYEVRARTREDRTEKVLTGDIDVPKDAYNGMIVTTLLNLPREANETVNVLAFVPEPMAIALELAFVGEQVIRIGDQSRKAWQYAFKPDIGPVKKFLGTMLGKLPTDFRYDCYILADEVPSFVRFEGPLQLMGPMLSIELISPQMALTAEDRKHAPR
ncbi:MAG TPA: hypothetical protein VJL88_16795 [Nitrospira sp.]|nr:hypothetical protein [Nitrospira sp.]